VIVLAVRWYLRFGLSYRDVEELLTERGIDVDHHHLPLGPTVHAAAGRRRPALPPPGRGSLVRGRDLRKGRRSVALHLALLHLVITQTGVLHQSP
jgi:hypothetical protein